MSEIQQAPAKSSSGKIIGFIGCGCLALIILGLLVGGGIFWGVGKALKSNDPYRDSIAAVEANPDAIAALGEPIKPGFIPTGNINIDNGEGTVDFSIPVSGPLGKGAIRVVGTKAAGSSTWVYETWQLEVEGSEAPILLGE